MLKSKYNMGKCRALLIGILLFTGLLFFAADHANAAELPNPQLEDIAVDTRPDYVIYVNTALNYITVRQQNADGTLTPVKAMVCSCGREGHRTPQGTFHTSAYYEWRIMVDNTYGQYAVRFNNQILFHSVPYVEASPDTLEWEEYNKLGESASLGCVRLSVADSKWIYDNCKPGTTVVVYADSEEVCELEIPEPIKIEEDSPYKNWDPTDTNINNPWLAEADGYIPFSGTIDEFDYIAYADRYPDLMEAFGYDKTALYNHYVTLGIGERRIIDSCYE
ncbi:MAG: L,D-transpeptidase [Lachnospiraceae bacterium]|nr:L,D-transpeptidase [Lachnospiraceae bacterium]